MNLVPGNARKKLLGVGCVKPPLKGSATPGRAVRLSEKHFSVSLCGRGCEARWRKSSATAPQGSETGGGS